MNSRIWGRLLKTVTVTAVLLSGCGKNSGTQNSEEPLSEPIDISEDISGDYYVIACSDAEGTQLELEDEFLRLNSDGTGYFQYRGNEYSLEWEYSGGTFSFVDDSGDEFVGSYHSDMIGGTYFNDYYYTFTRNKELYDSFQFEDTGEQTPAPKETAVAPDTGGMYYTMATLYEPTYGIRTANAMVPYGWSAGVNVEWGLCSTMYPAAATIVLISPNSDAIIEIRSTEAYLQMSRNGSWVPEGTYLDFYNTMLNYRNASNYNDFVLGKLGYKGTVLNRQVPGYEFQQLLSREAQTYLNALCSSNGITGKQCEGSYEKTTYFITSGNAYEIEISSAVLMAETINGIFDTYQWTVPYTAMFTAYSEEAYSAYSKLFDNVAANSTFCDEFLYVRTKNAEYLNEMMRNYLMERVYNPSSGDIRSWDSTYVEDDNDRFINEWCDVITEKDSYTTADGDVIKVPTSVDSVYQDGDTIYVGPDSQAPYGWTELNKTKS